jgi:phosphatidylserine/phosphatidylglycerophosphate/cardiolipin synthase-like enzyme
MKLRIKNSIFFFVFLIATSYSMFGSKEEALVYLRDKLMSGTQAQILKTFFTPDKEHSVKEILINLIRNEMGEIKAALYRLTEKDIALELLNAMKRGVKVCLIIDGGCFSDKNEKVTQLFKNGAHVNYFENSFAIMHHKYWIFKDNILGKILITGSANATRRGVLNNEENIIVLNDPSAIENFETNFQHLIRKTVEGIPSQNKQIVKKYLYQQFFIDAKKVLRFR